MSDDENPRRSRTYRIRRDAWPQLCAAMGWESVRAAARAIDVHYVTVYRVLNGETVPGPSFMAHLMYAVRETDWKHEDLFEITEAAAG